MGPDPRRAPDALAGAIADGRHLMTGVMISADVLVGVIAVEVAGVLILDPLPAAAVAVNILWSGYA